jgi:hypothetical protein
MSFATELLGRVAENRELARISGESSWQSGTEDEIEPLCHRVGGFLVLNGPMNQ